MEQNNIETSIIKKIEDLSTSILQSIKPEEIKNFQPYNIRYYDNRYFTGFNSDQINHDTLVRIHTNRLILLSIGKGHEIFRQKKKIEQIDFNVDGVNMSKISISGKKKAGGRKLKRKSIVCYLKCENDEEKYPVYATLPSTLIEVNQEVLKDPQLLVNDYNGLGYIGVLYVKCYGNNSLSVNDMAKKFNLMSEKQYDDYLNK